MTARIAVVMATFNGQRYVGAQLRSIVAQSRPPDEVIVTDDGSTDDTVAIVEDIANGPVRTPIRVVRGPCSGLADNFFHGLDQTECDIISWADQDDVWHPFKIAASFRALESFAAGFVSHAAQVAVGDELTQSGRRCPDYRRTRMLLPLQGDPWHVPSGFASMFRRELLDGVDRRERPISHQTQRPMNHDHVVSLAAFASTRRVELRQSLTLYRQHDANVAGDSTVHGTDAIREAMGTHAADYETLATITLGYADFVARLPRAVPGAVELLQQCADRVRRRSELYGSPSTLERARRLAHGVAKHDYGRRSTGHLSPLAFARDAVQVVAG